MKILIASDLHGSATAARTLSRLAETAPDLILLLGDLLYHGPRNPLPDGYNGAETATILSNLKPPIAAIRGNCEAEVDQLLLSFTLADSSWIEADRHLILAIHGHQLPENGGNFKIPDGPTILFGHTHVPLAEKRASGHFWNPGSLSLPKNNHPPSYGWYEDGHFEVRDLNDQVLADDRL